MTVDVPNTPTRLRMLEERYESGRDSLEDLLHLSITSHGEGKLLGVINLNALMVSIVLKGDDMANMLFLETKTGVQIIVPGVTGPNDAAIHVYEHEVFEYLIKAAEHPLNQPEKPVSRVTLADQFGWTAVNKALRGNEDMPVEALRDRLVEASHAQPAPRPILIVA